MGYREPTLRTPTFTLFIFMTRFVWGSKKATKKKEKTKTKKKNKKKKKKIVL